MAASTRILFDDSTLGGGMIKRAANYLILAQYELSRAKALADAVTGGGVTKTNLDGSSEFGTTVVDGTSLYDWIANAKANAASVTSAELAKIDHNG